MWEYIFLGATAMLFFGIITIWLIPIRQKQGDDKWKDDNREDMAKLQNYWIEGNKIAKERNNILQEMLNHWLLECVHDNIVNKDPDPAKQNRKAFARL